MIQEPNTAEVEDLLAPGEVARLFGVDPGTVRRWAMAGRLSVFKTLGGQRRYYASEVYELLDAGSVDANIEEEN
jgi:excisionase family DNA binding protein